MTTDPPETSTPTTTTTTVVPTATPLDGRRLLLDSGEVTLFLARADDDTPGHRTPVVTLHAPAIIAVPEAPESYVFVMGRGLSATTIPVDELDPTDPAHEDSMRAAARATLGILGEVIGPDAIPPGERVIRVGTRPVFVAAHRSAVVDAWNWVRVVEGTTTLARTPLPEGGAPIGPHLALAGDEFRALAATPLDHIALEDLLGGLTWLTGVAATGAAQRAARRRERELLWVRSAPGAAAATETAGMRLLARELTGEGSAIIPDSDPLLAIARAVASAGGFEVVAPRGGLRGREGTEAIRAIAVASRLFMRRVRLDGEWWNGLVDPMIAFTPEGTPVAILLRDERVVIVDPEGHHHRPGAVDAPPLLSSAFVLTTSPVEDRVTGWSMVRQALSGQRRPFLSYLAWSLIIAVIGLTVPMASGVVFGEIVPEGDRQRLVWLVVALIVAALAVLPIQVVSTIARTRLEAVAMVRFQRGLWGRVLRSPVALVQRIGPGDLAVRFASIEGSRSTIEQAVLGALPTMMSAVVGLVLLFVYDPLLAIVMVIWGGVVLIVSVVMAVRLASEQLQVERASGEVNGFLFQVLEAMPKLHVAAAESRAFATWASRVRDAIGLRLARRSAQQSLVNGIVGSMSTLVLFGAVALASSAARDVGTFIAFQTTNGLFMAGIAALASGVGTALQLRPTYQRAMELVAEPPESGATRIDPGPLQGRVALRNVTFRYHPDMAPVLNGLDLDIPAGEMVALVGHSGCGKSTVLRLLLGFEQPEEGTVLFDDQDLTSLDMTAVRRQLGVVLQDGQLMPGSIKENLAGATTLTDDEAWELADLVALGDDIRAMPMRLETMVSTNGGAFSGGQRQRLLIARALAARPRLLLLDEATSALDNVTQRVITQNLAELGMTRIVVAHRLSTIVDADRIVALDRGRVAEVGTFEELMEARGFFWRLANRQVV